MESTERRRFARLDAQRITARRRCKDSHHSVPRAVNTPDNKASPKHSPGHSLDRLASLHHRADASERPQRPSRLDFVNSNDVFVAVDKPKKIVSRSSSPEKCEQEYLRCSVRDAGDTIPRKYEDLEGADLTWVLNNSDRSIEKACDNEQSERERRFSEFLEKPSPIHSDDGNSPTALNTCRLLVDKPPLVKALNLDYMHHGFNPPKIHSDSSEKERMSLSVHLHRDSRSTCQRSRLENLANSQNAEPSGESGQQSQSQSQSVELPPELAELRNAPWFQAGLPREAALVLLSRRPEGSFLVRCSTSQRGCLALSLRVPRDIRPCGLAHYLIVKSPRGYRIKGFEKEFVSVRSLVTHHSVMPELLPVPLSLSRPQQVRDPSGNFVDLSDPEYNSIADFRKLMADLHV